VSLVRSRPLNQCDDAAAALAELTSGFVGAESLAGSVRTVAATELPEPFRRLLDHQKHMTLVLTSHYGAFLELRVKEMHYEGDLYSRKILLLTPREHRVVEYGLVRLDLRYVPEEVWREILQMRAPMGEILLRHNILQHVQPRWFLRCDPDSALLRWYGVRSDTPLYGRLGTIFCNDEPAVEVLEIVTGVQ
jgi:hypothetical protein